ncbi:MAG: hypothetical protein ACRCWP_00275 [Shewanella sp.]
MIEKPLKKTINNALPRLSVLFLINKCAELDINHWRKLIQNGVAGWIFRDNGIVCALQTKKSTRMVHVLLGLVWRFIQLALYFTGATSRRQ